VLIADLEHGLPAEVGSGYDAVLMSHMLEHLTRPQRLLEDARRALGGTGVLAVALPNVLVYPNRIRLLRGDFEYTDGGLMDDTHVRFYTFASGAELLRANGWEVLAARADGAFPLWRVRSLFPQSWVNMLDQRVCRWRPGLFGFQSLYIARPRTESAVGECG
jgi:SAM-dependent methyltransferase